MAKTEEVSKALTQNQRIISLQEMIERSAKELGRALPAHLRPERLVRIALTNIRLNPDLARSTPESFIGALFTAAQVGLEPIAGRSYLIPFKNKRKIGDEWKTVLETEFVIGYKGLIELFYRHEAALSIDMQVVHAKDNFSNRFGTDAYLHHTPELGNRGEVKAYYSVAKLRGGGVIFHVMSRDEVLEHAKRHSKSYDREKGEFYASSPWAHDFDAMGMKTVLIQLAKRLPLSVELQSAIQADETSRDYRSGVDSMLDVAPTTVWVEENQGKEPLAETKAKAPAETKAEAKAEAKSEAKTSQ